MSASDYLIDRENRKGDEMLAKHLGLTYDELIDNYPEITENESKDGHPYGSIAEFPESTPKNVLAKIKGIDSNRTVSLPPNVYGEEEDNPNDY